jgi:hypothetical protein
MLLPILKAIPFACILTALFALRFRMWRRPKALTAYFAFFFGLHWFGERYLLPPEAFGWEVAVVLLFITGLLVAVIVALDGHERRHGHDD